MSPALCQRRKCRSHQLASSLAEEPNCLFAFWSLKKILARNKCLYVADSFSSWVQQTFRVLWKPTVLGRHHKSHPLSVHHHTIQINQPTRCNNFWVYYLTFIYTSTCFGRPHAHYQELNNCSNSLWFYLRSVVIAAFAGRGRDGQLAITTLLR